MVISKLHSIGPILLYYLLYFFIFFILYCLLLNINVSARIYEYNLTIRGEPVIFWFDYFTAFEYFDTFNSSTDIHSVALSKLWLMSIIYLIKYAIATDSYLSYAYDIVVFCCLHFLDPVLHFCWCVLMRVKFMRLLLKYLCLLIPFGVFFLALFFCWCFIVTLRRLY